MQNKNLFFITFLATCFVAKIAAEFVHEVCGHGFFVLLFGGKVETVYISIFWPYEMSYISWSLPSGVTSAQMAWIYGGGILVCLCASFLIQASLLVKKGIPSHFALTLFWLAFWTSINSAGYLVIGGLTTFGDIHELIRLEVFTNTLSLMIGFIIFIVGFAALSWILREILTEIFPLKKASLGVVLFWLIIPALVLVMLVSPERGLQVAYFPLAFIPVLLSFVTEYFLVLSKQKANANPHDVA